MLNQITHILTKPQKKMPAGIEIMFNRQG